MLATMLAAAAWATTAFNQTLGASGAAKGRPGLQLDGEEAMNPGSQASDRLVDRAMENIDRLPEDLQEEVAALRDSSTAIREKWEAEYRPGADASAEELLAAREQFQEDLATEIETNRDLRKEVVTRLRDELRGPLKDTEMSDETQAKFQAYNEVKLNLNAAWREARAALGANANKEEVNEARKRFIEENAEQIAKQQELAQEIRELVRSNAGQGNPGKGRGQLPPALQELRSEVHLARKALQEEKREARDTFRGLSPEDREMKREQILKDFREAHDDIKESRRRLIEDLRGNEDGDRRSED